MATDIKMIEDLSLNAWPSFQMQVYDGWIIRFSYFYTHRTNCAEQIGASVLPLDEKILYTEQIYRKWGTPCIFKVTPAGDPGLDLLLEKRGYRIEHATTVMTRSLEDLFDPDDTGMGDTEILARGRVDEEWLGALFSLKGTREQIYHRIVPQMYDAIPMDEIAVTARSDGRVIGTGLGILDRGYVGVYAIYVDEPFRRRGVAGRIVDTILSEAKRRGMKGAYLQVVSDNAAAKALYRSKGFRDAYCYYFRVNDFSVEREQ